MTEVICLSEQLELLYRETNAYQEEIEVDSVNRLEMGGQIQIEEENLETNAFQDEMEIESDQYRNRILIKKIMKFD